MRSFLRLFVSLGALSSLSGGIYDLPNELTDMINDNCRSLTDIISFGVAMGQEYYVQAAWHSVMSLLYEKAQDLMDLDDIFEVENKHSALRRDLLNFIRRTDTGFLPLGPELGESFASFLDRLDYGRDETREIIRIVATLNSPSFAELWQCMPIEARLRHEEYVLRVVRKDRRYAQYFPAEIVSDEFLQRNWNYWEIRDLCLPKINQIVNKAILEDSAAIFDEYPAILPYFYMENNEMVDISKILCDSTKLGPRLIVHLVMKEVMPFTENAYWRLYRYGICHPDLIKDLFDSCPDKGAVGGATQMIIEYSEAKFLMNLTNVENDGSFAIPNIGIEQMKESFMHLVSTVVRHARGKRLFFEQEDKDGDTDKSIHMLNFLLSYDEYGVYFPMIDPLTWDPEFNLLHALGSDKEGKLNDIMKNPKIRDYCKDILSKEEAVQQFTFFEVERLMKLMGIQLAAKERNQMMKVWYEFQKSKTRTNMKNEVPVAKEIQIHI